MLEHDNFNVRAVDLSGNPLWEIPVSDLVDDVIVLGGHIFLKNESGQVFGIDDASGTQTAADPTFLEIAKTLLDGGSMQVNAATGTALIQREDDGAVKLMSVPSCMVR